MRIPLITLTCLVAFGFSNALISQNKREINSSIEKSLEFYKESDFLEAESTALEVLKSSAKIDYKRGIAWGNLLTGVSKNIQHEGVNAINFMEAALVDSAYFDKEYLIILKFNLADFYYNDEKYERASKFYKSAIKYYDKTDDFAKQVDLMTKLGMVYLATSSYVESQELLEKAYYLGLKHNIKDNRFGSALFGLAKLYQVYQDFISAKKFLHQSIKIFEQYVDRGDLTNAYNRLGEIYLAEKKADSALISYQKMNQRATNLKRKSQAYYGLGLAFLELQEYDSANKNISKGIKSSKEGYPEYAVHFSYLKSRILLNDGKYNEALDFANDFEINARNSENHYMVYLLLKEIYKNRNQLDSAYYYHQLFLQKRDSIVSRLNDETFGSFRKRISTAETQLQIEAINSETRVSQLIGKGAIITSFLGLLVIAVSLRVYWLRNKEKELVTTIEKQKIEYELKRYQSELSELTLSMIRKNVFLEELYTLTLASKKDPSKKRRIINAINQNRSGEKDWEEFNDYFGNVHRDFFLTLQKKFPGITRKELRHAALIRLGLSLEQAAQILGVGSHAVKVARYRLRKKYDIQNEFFLNLDIGGEETT